MKKCWVVDRSKAVRLVSRSILENLGFRVVDGDDAEELWTNGTDEVPDLVLAEWPTQAVSGLELVRRFRDIDDIRQPIIIFCSGETDPEKIGQAVESGVDEYIMKPFDNEILESKLALVGFI